MEDKQAVVGEAEDSAQQESQATDAQEERSELDKILDEFPADEPEQAEPKDDPDLAKKVSELEKEVVHLRTQPELTSLASQIRGDLDAEVFDDDFVISWLDSRAKKDPRVRSAWMNRGSNPSAFGKVVKEMGKQFQSITSKLPNQEVTEDRDAMEAAVRSASTKTAEIEQPNFQAMSDAEIQQWKRQQTGNNPFG